MWVGVFQFHKTKERPFIFTLCTQCCWNEKEYIVKYCFLQLSDDCFTVNNGSWFTRAAIRPLNLLWKKAKLNNSLILQCVLYGERFLQEEDWFVGFWVSFFWRFFFGWLFFKYSGKINIIFPRRYLSVFAFTLDSHDCSYSNPCFQSPDTCFHSSCQIFKW